MKAFLEWDRVLGTLVGFSRRHPWWVLAGALALAAASVVLAAQRLEFKTARSALVSPDQAWHRRYLAYQRDFEAEEDVIIALSNASLEERQRFADALAARLAVEPMVNELFYRVDPAPFEQRALLYLSDAQMEDLRTELEEHREQLLALTQNPSLAEVLRVVDRRVSAALVESVVSGLLTPEEEEANGKEPLDLSFFLRLLGGMEAAITPGVARGGYQSPWEAFFGIEGVGQEGYLVSENEQFLFLLVKPKKTPGFDRVGPALERLRFHLGEVASQFPQVSYGLTGQPVLGSEEVRTSSRDASIAGVLALFGVTAVFWAGLRRWRQVALAVVALVVGIAWAAGATALWVGHLTILSAAFVSMLLGLGVDYGIHFLARYDEERERLPVEPALDRTASLTGPGIFYGALTSIMAFYAIALTDFLGIAELGLIAGTGLILCLLSTFTVLPALLSVFSKRGGLAAPVPSSSGRLFQPLFRRPGWVLAVAGVLTVASLLLLPRVRYDANLLELQAEGVEAVALERALLQAAGRSSIFAVSVGSDLHALRQLADQLEALPEVSKVESMAELIPDRQPERIARAEALAPQVEGIPVTPVRPAGIDYRALGEWVDRLRFKVRPSDRWSKEQRPDEAQLVQAQRLLQRIHTRLPLMSPAERAQLEAYQRQVAADLFRKLGLLVEGVRPQPISIADVPPALRARLMGREGQYLVRIFPTENVWQPAAMKRFIGALRTVDAQVTGPAVQVFESTRVMREGYLQGGLYALVAVAFLLVWAFRSFLYAGLAAVPLVVGGLWTLGFMGWRGVAFNLANLVVIPLVIGIGIDTGIHLVQRYREGGRGGLALLTTSTARAVTVAALTSAVGFGSLLFAQHQGMRSIGQVLTAGLLLVLLAAWLCLAPLLELLARRRAAARGDVGETELHPRSP